MGGEELVELVRKMDLPAGQFVIIGGAIMAALDIRPTSDLDLFVTSELYEDLKSRYGGEIFAHNQHYLVFEVDDTQVEASRSWNMPGYQPDFESYLKSPNLILGLPFMPLEDVYEWKAVTRRPKDLVDIALIDAYRSRIS